MLATSSATPAAHNATMNRVVQQPLVDPHSGHLANNSNPGPDGPSAEAAAPRRLAPTTHPGPGLTTSANLAATQAALSHKPVQIWAPEEGPLPPGAATFAHGAASAAVRHETGLQRQSQDTSDSHGIQLTGSDEKDAAVGIPQHDIPLAAATSVAQAWKDTPKSPQVPKIRPMNATHLEEAARQAAERRLKLLDQELSEARSQRIMPMRPASARRGTRGSSVSSPAGRSSQGEHPQYVDLMSIARRNVENQLAGIDVKIAERRLVNRKDWEEQASRIAEARSEHRMKNHGKINIGGGKFVDAQEVNKLAAQNVRPILERLTAEAEEVRARERDERREVEQRRRREQRTRGIHKEAKKTRGTITSYLSLAMAKRGRGVEPDRAPSPRGKEELKLHRKSTKTERRLSLNYILHDPPETPELPETPKKTAEAPAAAAPDVKRERGAGSLRKLMGKIRAVGSKPSQKETSGDGIADGQITQQTEIQREEATVVAQEEKVDKHIIAEGLEVPAGVAPVHAQEGGTAEVTLPPIQQTQPTAPPAESSEHVKEPPQPVEPTHVTVSKPTGAQGGPQVITIPPVDKATAILHSQSSAATDISDRGVSTAIAASSLYSRSIEVGESSHQGGISLAQRPSDSLPSATVHEEERTAAAAVAEKETSECTVHTEGKQSEVTASSQTYGINVSSSTPITTPSLANVDEYACMRTEAEIVATAAKATIAWAETTTVRTHEEMGSS